MRKVIAVLSAVLLLALTGCDKSGVYSNGEGESIFADPPKSSAQQSSSSPVSSVTEDDLPESSSSSLPPSSPEVDPATAVGNKGETITVYGKPVETLSEFNYDRLYEQRKADIESGSMKELGELLDSLGKPEVKDLYIRARAVTDGFANDGYFLGDGAHIRVRDGGSQSYYDETGFSYDSFTRALKSIFTEQTTQSILTNAPYMYEYDGALWQGGITPPRYDLHTEYQLVENLDDSVTFNTVNYLITDITEDYDPAKKDSYEKKTLSNRISRTSGGWRIERFAVFGVFSSRTGEESELTVDPDFLTVPDGANWIPLYTRLEALANSKELLEPLGGQTAEAIIRTLVNRNILAFDIVHGRGWETVGTPIDGVSVYEISSEYFSTLEELNDFFYGTYTKETADGLLTVNGAPIFSERGGKLCADVNLVPVWITMPFIYKTYAEPTSVSPDKYVFKWHYVDVDDVEAWERAAEMTFVIELTDDGFRLASPVFDDPGLDMSEESA